MSAPNPTLQAHRIVVCHKHPSSGRLQFVRFDQGNICGPAALPKLAVLHECQERDLLIHPAAALRMLAEHLDIDAKLLMLCGDFHLYLEVPHQYAADGMLPLLLVAVSGHALPNLPPGHGWIELPDSMSLPYLEREILRAAYKYLMG